MSSARPAARPLSRRWSAWFQSIIGQEASEQILEQPRQAAGPGLCLCRRRLQCHGHLSRFSRRPGVNWSGSRPAATGLDTGRHAASLCGKDASPGVAQGYKTMFLQNNDGQMRETHSVAAGLDYVGVSPILCRSWREKAGPLRGGHRRGGHGRPRPDHAHGRDHPGPGIGPCLCPGL